MKVLKRAVVWVLRATGIGTAAVLAAFGLLAQPLALPVWIMLGAMVGAGIALHQNHRGATRPTDAGALPSPPRPQECWSSRASP